jgi:hypothetical protein
MHSRDRVNIQVATIDSTYTVSPDDDYVFAATAGGAFTATLPAASSVRPGKEIHFKKTDVSANDFTVSRAGSDTIDGNNTRVLGAQYDQLTIVSNGANWFVLNAVLNA